MSAPADEAEAVHEAALRLLARRDHASGELTTKLIQRGFDRARVEAELARLTEAGLLDDARFAEAFAEQRAERGDGPIKIEAALRQRGIAAEVSAAALDGVAPDWPAHARAALAKRFGATPAADQRERARRARFLQGRGFPAELVRRLLDDD